jgi:hypothetical protein
MIGVEAILGCRKWYSYALCAKPSRKKHSRTQTINPPGAALAECNAGGGYCDCGGAGAPCLACNHAEGHELPPLPFTVHAGRRVQASLSSR